MALFIAWPFFICQNEIPLTPKPHEMKGYERATLSTSDPHPERHRKNRSCMHAFFTKKQYYTPQSAFAITIWEFFLVTARPAR